MNTALLRGSLTLAAFLAATAWSGLALAQSQSMTVPLSGAQEVPAVSTTATGTAVINYNPATHIVTWNITYSGLTSPATMAHFHNAAPGKNAPVAVWLSTPGEPASNPIKGQKTLTPAQGQQLLAGDWYINVHSKDHPAGEIRGQVKP